MELYVFMYMPAFPTGLRTTKGNDFALYLFCILRSYAYKYMIKEKWIGLDGTSSTGVAEVYRGRLGSANC